MTNPHTTLSEAIRALELPEPEYIGSGGNLGYTEGMMRTLLSAAADLVEQDESNADEWRRLALQFDGHRVQALGHLRALLANAQKHAPIAQEFVSAPPLDGESVLAQRIAALVEQHEAQEPKLPTDISNRLRDVATGGDQYYTNTANSLLRAAADEIERYYGGMMNWKWNAQHKDTQMAEYRAKLAEQPTLAATQAGDANSIKELAIQCAAWQSKGMQFGVHFYEEGLSRFVDAILAHPTASTTPVAEDASRLAQEGGAWQPIESAPKDGTYILLGSISSGGAWVGRFQDQYQSGYRPPNPWQSMMLNTCHLPVKYPPLVPTHWMPLPSAPTTTRSE